MTRLRVSRGLVALGLLLILGCAPVDTNVQVDASDAWIRTEWALDEPEPDSRRMSGYIYNTRNYHAGQVRLLVEALDGANHVVDRRYQWVPGGVPANNRAYFEVRGLPPADHYRVTVPYYTWEDGPGGGIFRRRF